jgi:F-type H+-transporting ATPase subunit epsilon
MNLKVLLPFKVLIEETGVTHIQMQTQSGSFGVLPNRLDCVSALSPGILHYHTKKSGDNYVAVDEGVFVKTGINVAVSVRRAVAGKDLSLLEAAVERDYLTLSQDEKATHAALAKLEAGFVSRFASIKDGQ